MGNVYALADDTRENQRMNSSPIDWLWNTGILQFGYFVSDEEVAPVRFCPDYLPAYPHLLAEVAQLALPHLDVSEIDHLIVTANSVPLGVALSLQTGLSLVYSRGRGEAAVYDLVGSYNSGHISALVVNHIEDVAAFKKFMSNARSLGLETRKIVTLLEMKPIGELAGIPVSSVFRLSNIVQALLSAGRLSDGQAQAVLKWVESRVNTHSKV